MGVSSSKPHPIQTKWFPEFESKLPLLEGKTVAITGCTAGTGYIVARTAIKKGAENVLLLNRLSERSQKAEDSLKEKAVKAAATGGNKKTRTNVETIPCDLQDFASVRQAATTIKSKYEAVDVLCNNAGVMALEDKATKDGYDIQVQTNHLSHFLLTKELYPLLKRANELRGSATVANHSSEARLQGGRNIDARYFGQNGGKLGGNGNSMIFGGARWVRYQQSKLANSVFTRALADRFGGGDSSSGLKATLAHPGLAATNLQISTASDGGMGSGMWIMRFSQSQEDGAMPIIAACFDPSSKNGTFWGPSGAMQFTGPAKILKWDKLSLDEKSRKVLWEKSEEACGKFEVV